MRIFRDRKNVMRLVLVQILVLLLLGPSGLRGQVHEQQPVQHAPVLTPNLIGPVTACEGSTMNVYSTDPGQTAYLWAVSSGGNITSGSDLSSITVTWNIAGPQTVSVSYFNSTVTTLDVNVLPSLPVLVSVSVSANPVCAGTSVTYTATSSNGGGTPVYEWSVNSVNAWSGSVFSYIPTNGDVITCQLTSNLLCTTGNPANSVPVTMIVNPNLPVSVSITSSSNPSCEGSSVTFSALQSNGGSSPSYQWKVNGTGAGSDSPVFSYVPLSGDIVTCILTSNEPCVTGNPAVSNAIVMTVSPNLPVSVVIAASANPSCSGNPVVFTATPANGGSSPVYNWFLNGTSIGISTPTYSYTPASGDVVTCSLNSSGGCTSGNPANSNPITMAVQPYAPVSVTISASSNPACNGVPVTFTATPVNGGSSPGYLWFVNGTQVSSSGPGYIYTPNQGDIVSCHLTSNALCSTGNPAISNFINMTVSSSGASSVSIVSSGNPTCQGTITTYTATPVNGGTSPVYQWKVNGVNAGTGNSTFAYIPVNGDLVTCTMTSNSLCSSGTPVVSNTVVMSVSPVQNVSISITALSNPVCQGSTVSFTSAVISGGTSPAFQWQVNGINSGTGSTFSYTPLNNDIVTCILTSNAMCTTGNPATSNSVTMIVSPFLPVSVSIVAAANPICIGQSGNFTATPVNGGTNPQYQWKLNGLNIGVPSSLPTFSYPTINNGDVISCVHVSNNGCPTGNPATSNPITMEVDPLLPVSITIAASANPSCQGSPVTFTATTANGGSTPFYQWKVNGVNAGANLSMYTYVPATGNVVTCQVTSSITCPGNNPATSNAITMVINPIVTAGITIVPSGNPVCTGTQVTFTATALNGGSSPVYQWMLNGANISTNNPILVFIPVEGDVITCKLTSSLMCVSGNPVTSDPLVMHASTPLPGAISITASSNPFCQGSLVSFFSSITNGGSSPVYEWRVNGGIVSSSPTYSYIPSAGDFVSCKLTSSLTCSTGPVTSTPILMILASALPASVTIVPSENPVCQGSPVTFMATPVNGGTTPAYQWKVDGTIQPGNSPIFTFTPGNGNVVTCRLTSNAFCVSGSPVISPPVAMSVSNALPAGVTINTLTNPYCQGTVVNFTASPVNGGPTPVYAWKVNGLPSGSNSPAFAYVPANGDIVTCELLSNSSCITGTNPVISNQIVMTESTSLPVSVVIASSANPSCQGTSVTYTASQTNGGTLPVYQWKVNGSIAGTNSPVYTYTPSNGQVVTCTLTSNLGCGTGSPAVSNAITMVVTTTVIPSVSITASVNPVCTGTPVTFTATPVNGGPLPVYTWRVNGMVASGATNSTYTYSPANYDAVTCQLMSNATCNSGVPVISNQVTMLIAAQQTVGITISTLSTLFCLGATVSFTSAPTNGGAAPLYQWKVNGANGVNGNNSTFSYAPANGDIVTCVLTSNQSCITNNPATSNSIIMTAGTGLPVGITISADINPICEGTRVFYTAVPVNGGSAPVYQWMVNGVSKGANIPTYQYFPVVGDVVTCTLTSSLAGCVSGNPATSNTISMIVYPGLPVSVTVTPSANPSCIGNSVCYTAAVVNGGTSPIYYWKKNGVNVTNPVNSPNYCYTPANGDIISCRIISNEMCTAPGTNPANSNNIPMIVLPISPAFVSIAATANPVCQGTAVTYTATPVNGGTAPVYEWKVNGMNATGSTNSSVYSYAPVNTDVVTSLMTSNAYCVSTGVVTSNPLAMTVSSYIPVSVAISASVNPVCMGSPVTVMAVPQNGGTGPVYQWKVNGNITGSNGPSLTYIPANGDVVTCTLTSNDACTTGNPALSNAVALTVLPTLPVSVSIAALTTPACQGPSVTFVATTINGGVNPLYQWLVNGMIVGANASSYTYIPSSGDVVACHLTSDIICATGNPALSNQVTMNFSPYLPVSVSITCSANPACQGTPANFIATQVNGGSVPVWHWKVNGIIQPGNLPAFSYNPVNGDVVTCELVSDIPCPIANPVTSNSITMSVLVPQVSGISISASANPVCAGTSVIYTAIATNGGSSPVYQWTVNGSILGINLPAYTYMPANGDVISCQMTSSISCISNNPVGSNQVTMVVGSDFPASVSIAASSNPVCQGQQVTLTATPVNGGQSPLYQWFSNGINVGVNSPAYTYTPTTGDIISCQLTSGFACASGSPAASNTVTMTVSPILPVSVSIVSSSNPACVGILITYTATTVNGGAAPSWQWKVNGVNAGTSLSTFAYAPANGDVVTCVAASSDICASGNPATSNPVSMIIGSSFPVSVTITVSDNPVCQVTPVTFSAVSAYGGPSPSFQWYINGNPVGNNSTTYSYFPDNGDVVTCVVTSQLSCAIGNPATSNAVTMVVLPIPVSVTIGSNAAWPVCAGTIVTYTSYPINGGPSPTFQWKVNGIAAGTNNIAFSYAPADGEVVTCTLMSNATCASGNTVTSAGITAQVNPGMPVSVVITSGSGNTVCSGTTVIYTVSSVNEGSSPVYQWKVNGINQGTGSTAYSYMPIAGDVVTCVLTSDITCATGNPAISNAIIMTVDPLVPVSVTVLANANPVCAGTSVNFTALGVNAGSAPGYQWKVNGLNVGANSIGYSYAALNGDAVTCTLTSNETGCLGGNPANSNVISMVVNPVLPVSVAITASANPFCNGAPVTLTAIAVNGGAAPAYQWKVNGANVGTSIPVYTYTPSNNDVVTCTVLSNEVCPAGNPAVSNMLTMIVNLIQPVSISVTPSVNPVCSGSQVTFTATGINGGTAPVYLWKVNGTNVGTDNPVYSYTPANNDVVICVLTSNENCATGNPATSAPVTMTVNPTLPVSVMIISGATTVCAGTSVTFTALQANGGVSPVYQWKVNGVNAGGNFNNYTYTPANGDFVACELTSNAICPTGNPALSNVITITVNPLKPVSASVTATANPVCAGTSVNFTSSVANGGTNPQFQWKVNGVNTGSGASSFSVIPVNGDIITCLVTSNEVCATNNPVLSNAITMTVNPNLPVSIAINASANPVCATTSVVFTGTGTNGGAAPSYQWILNGTNVAGATNSIYIDTPLNNDVVKCELISNATCATGNPATSATVTMTVNPVMPVSITVVPSANPVCAGSSVTFNATGVNGGVAPMYQWKVNGVNAGANIPAYTYVPVNGDLISCIFTSSDVCASGSPAVSGNVAMVVKPILPVSVAITASANPVCAGIPLTLTAAATNGGTLPLYEWKVNGISAGINNPVYTYLPANNDVITCILTSGEMCTTGNPATSGAITITVNPVFPVGVSVSATPSASVCAGTLVTFTAAITNGGSSPLYQWKVNGANVGPNNAVYSYIPLIGDVVACQLTSNVTCGVNNPALSSPLTVLLSPQPVVIYNTCNDLVTAADGKPFRLKGGLPLGGTYTGPGVNPVTGIFDPAVAGVGIHQVTYSYTNVGLCSSSAIHPVDVRSTFSGVCGSNVIDYRDNQSYPTVLIGTQCWFSKNLNIGSMVTSTQVQTDNCTIEKYCLGNIPANCNIYGGHYQWDELMRSEALPGGQGLCPPGWHVPTVADWLTLMNFYSQQSQAGTPLKEMASPTGFKALLSGVLYQNNAWSFDQPGLSATFFWTSESSGATKAMVHGLNNVVGSVSDYESSRGNAMVTRCIRD